MTEKVRHRGVLEMSSIAIGADDAAFELKEILAQHMRDKGYEVKDFGVHSKDSVDYPDIAGRGGRSGR
jgi:ribose 5-phosphate isomerase B